MTGVWRELAYQLGHSECETVITLPMFLENLAKLQEKTPVKRVVNSRLADFVPSPVVCMICPE